MQAARRLQGRASGLVALAFLRGGRETVEVDIDGDIPAASRAETLPWPYIFSRT
jgi:hypothetical protein